MSASVGGGGGGGGGGEGNKNRNQRGFIISPRLNSEETEMVILDNFTQIRRGAKRMIGILGSQDCNEKHKQVCHGLNQLPLAPLSSVPSRRSMLLLTSTPPSLLPSLTYMGFDS
jgi:hypothetical protein